MARDLSKMPAQVEITINDESWAVVALRPDGRWDTDAGDNVDDFQLLQELKDAIVAAESKT